MNQIAPITEEYRLPCSAERAFAAYAQRMLDRFAALVDSDG